MELVFYIRLKKTNMEFAEGNVIARYILNICNTEEKEYMQGWLNESPYNRFIYNHILNSLTSSNSN